LSRAVKGLVLDASALLAVFFEETGAEVVAPVLFGASVSAVNYSEVIKKVLERRGNFELTRNFLDRQSLRIVAFDTARAIAAARILAQTSEFGLSFADRACMSLGLELDYTVVTAERRMSLTGLNVDVRLIRNSH